MAPPRCTPPSTPAPCSRGARWMRTRSHATCPYACTYMSTCAGVRSVDGTQSPLVVSDPTVCAHCDTPAVQLHRRGPLDVVFGSRQRWRRRNTRRPPSWRERSMPLMRLRWPRSAVFPTQTTLRKSKPPGFQGPVDPQTHKLFRLPGPKNPQPRQTLLGVPEGPRILAC